VGPAGMRKREFIIDLHFWATIGNHGVQRQMVLRCYGFF
jgi:hypothetical protein